MAMAIHTAENETNFKQIAFVIAASMMCSKQRHGCNTHTHKGMEGASYIMSAEINEG
jgi:hypothetical protein